MYRDILLPVDLEHEGSWRTALPVALAHCEAFGARLHLLTVVPGYGSGWVEQFFPDDFEAKAEEMAGERLRAFAEAQVPDGIDVQCVVACGTIYHLILDTAAETGVDLIVMAAHHPELRDYLLGPNAAKVVRHAGCSVLVVRE